MEEIHLIMVVEKETDNTKRFAEAAPPGTREHVKKLYVSKATLRELGNPEDIEVVIRPLKKA